MPSVTEASIDGGTSESSISACSTPPRTSASSRPKPSRSRTLISLSRLLTPYTRLAAFAASRFSRKLPTVPRSVTSPSSVETAIASLSTRGSQKSSSSTSKRSSSLDMMFSFGWWSRPVPTTLRLDRLAGRTVLRGLIRVAYDRRRPVRPPVAQEDLDRRRGRDGQQRAEDPEQRRADQDREDRDDRVDLERPAVDDGLDERVLDALVDHDEHDPHDRGGGEVDGGGGDGDDDRAQRRADERDEVEEADEQTERERIGDAEQRQHQPRGDRREPADRDVAQHVLGDGPVDVDDERPVPRLAITRQAQCHPHVLAPVEHQQEREREDREQLADDAERLHRDALERARRVLKPAGQRARVALELGRDLVAVVVVAERRVAA